MGLLRWLLGLEPAPWPEGGGGWALDLLALPRGDGLFGLLVVAALVIAGLFVLYRLEARRLSRPSRLMLTGLRLLVVALAALMLLEPAVVRRKVEPVRSNLLVLVDESQSMTLRDAWAEAGVARATAEALGLPGVEALREASRGQLGERALHEELMEALRAGGDRELRIHRFTDRLSSDAQSPAEATQAAGDEEPEDQPTIGNPAATALGSALRQALLAYRGLPIAGVLLLTDGQSNTGPAPTEAAQLAADAGIPVAALALGTERGPRNLALRRLEVDPVVFVRDTNRLSAFLEARGMSGQTATVVLEQRREGGVWQEVDRREVLLGDDGQLQELTFDFAEPEPTRLEFRALLADPGPQLTRDDDTALAQSRVIRQQLRVLLIAGSTFPEIQFMRNALLRDKSIELASWLQSADPDYQQPGDNPISRLPNSAKELDEFDCVILYDPDPDRLPPGFSPLLVDFVARSGGGLVYIAGEFYTRSNFDRQGDPSVAWLDILPVIREPGLFRSAVQLRLSRENAWHLDITPAGRTDPIFAFQADPEANRRVLESLPGMYWHFPVTRAKPGATVLARHGDARMRNQYGPEVLMATQLVGPGRTFFLGFDSTYRWRYLDEAFFEGFWARVADRAGRSKQLGGVYPFRLTTDRATYQPGAQVNVEARFNSPEQMDPSLSVLYGEVERAGDQPEPVTLLPQGDGVFAASVSVRRPGPHLLRVWPGDESTRTLARPATARFDVALPNLEYQNPTLDLATLRALCAATGGRAVTPDRVNEIPGLFGIRTVDRVLEDRQEIWDAPLLWALLLAALIGEWVLRKKHRLI
jgi:hypothetical protein